MVVILGIGLVAAAAQYIYNKATRENPEKAETTVKSFRQSTGVLAALVTAVVAVLDALSMIRRVLPTMGPTNGTSTAAPPGGKMFGATVASDTAT